MSTLNLNSTYLRLRTDTSVEKLPVDTTFWPRLMSGALGDFHNEYLITSLSYDFDWDSWEMHPNGDEIVCLISGEVDFLLETSEEIKIEKLASPGDYVIIPKGVWHTSKTSTKSTLIFLTPGEGTLNRPAE